MSRRTRALLASLLLAGLIALGLTLSGRGLPYAPLAAFLLPLVGVGLLLWQAHRLEQGLRRWQRYLDALQPDEIPPLPDAEMPHLGPALRRALRRSAEAHRAQSARLAQGEAVIRQMSDGILVVTPDGRIGDLNPMAERLFGVTAAQVRGRTLAQGLRHHRVVALWQSCRESRAEQRDLFEIPATKRFVQVVATPLDAEDTPQVLLLLQDLTQVRRLETIRRDFVANLSHELRTPLAALQALAETLQGGALEDTQAARRFLQRILDEVAALNRLVQDLLDLARLESGRLGLQLSPQAPAELLRQAAERAALAAQEAGVTLHIQAPEDLPPVLADRQRILQVLANLLDNAIRFTPPGGSITLGAAATGPVVRFWVQDTGIGIPPEHLPRIFERFYKVDAARQRRGTGLGLAIARHIVEAHQGRIGAESQVGQGSRFWFTLPEAR